MVKRKADTDLTPDKGHLAAVRLALLDWEGKNATVAGSKLYPYPTILAIDPGTVNLAVCILDGDTVITSKITLPELPTIASKCLYVEAVLGNWIDSCDPDVIVKEGVAFGQKFGVAESGRVQYAIERVAYGHNKPLLTITPLSMRKYVGSSGAGKTKSDTKLAIYKKWGVELPSEDETDAFGLAKTGRAIYRGEFVITASKPKKVKSG